MQSLLLLFGVWLVLQNLAYAIWGGDTQSILTPYTMESVQIFGGRFGIPQILVFVVSILSLVGLNLVLRRTFLGKAIRAVTQNRDAAMLSGVNAGQIAAVAFGIGTAFAAMAGSMLSTLYAFTPDFGRSFLLKAFCIIVLGGMESFTGVAVGALVLAFIENFASAYTSIPVSYQDAISFTLLVVVLVAAPGGLPGLWRLLDRRVVAR
jgi:branched-chain amino acid transport system permease protein